MDRFNTRYINPLTYVTRDERRIKAEIQVEPTEDAGGVLLDLRVHSFKSGSVYGTAELNRSQAVELRDALDAWIATQPAPQAEGATQVMDHPYAGESRRGASCQFIYADDQSICARMEAEHGPIPTTQPVAATRPDVLTRVVESVGDPGKWQAQYHDPVQGLWFDIGDAQAVKADADQREADYLARH